MLVCARVAACVSVHVRERVWACFCEGCECMRVSVWADTWLTAGSAAHGAPSQVHQRCDDGSHASAHPPGARVPGDCPPALQWEDSVPWRPQTSQPHCIRVYLGSTNS